MQYSDYDDIIECKLHSDIINNIKALAMKQQTCQLNILDIGCGLGAISLPLSYLGHKVTGVDVDSKSIEWCKKRTNSPHATFIVADGSYLNIPDEFDVIVCARVLEHVEKPKLLLGAIKKHLSVNGIAMIHIPNGLSFYEIIFSRLCSKIGISRLCDQTTTKNLYYFNWFD